MESNSRSCLSIFFFLFTLSLFPARAEQNAIKQDVPATAENHLASKKRQIASDSGLAVLGCSAISDLVKVNGNKIPSSLRELISLLDHYGSARGGVERVIVPFSQAPGSSGLAKPRVLIKVASNANGTIPDRKNKKPLNLEGRLFAALTSHNSGSQTLEFISWNKQRKAFDFGVIENFNNLSKRRVIVSAERTQQCLVCHRTRGPIFPDAPWSTTADGHAATQMAMVERLAQTDPEHYRVVVNTLHSLKDKSKNTPPSNRILKLIEDGTISNKDIRRAIFKEMLEQNPVTRNARLFIGGEDTGVSLFNFSNLDNLFFDSDVRTANQDLLLNQATQALNTESRQKLVAAGMRALTATLLTDNKGKDERAAYRNVLVQLIGPQISKLPALRSGSLRNFSPSTAEELSDETRHEEESPFNEKSIRRILSYDEDRQAGRAKQKKEMSPTNPDTFSSPSEHGLDPAKRFGETDSRTGLEDFLNITAADKDFIHRLVSLETEQNKREIIGQVLASRDWELLAQTSQGFPSRSQFLRSLASVVEGERSKLKLPISDAANYLDNLPADGECLSSDASRPGPGLAINSAGSCRSCHVGASALKPLPFDPQDEQEWTRRLGGTNSSERTAARRLLDKTMLRLRGDGARMPPPDSSEAATFTAEQRKQLIRFLENLR